MLILLLCSTIGIVKMWLDKLKIDFLCRFIKNATIIL